MFSGPLADIPQGWQLCDGTNGTPNLKDRFIVGAGNSYALGSIGGEATHKLSINEMPSHTHSLNTSFAGTINLNNIRIAGAFGSLSWGGEDPYNFQPYETGGSAGFSFSLSLSGNTVATGGNLAHENRPPYYALYFIMKIQA